MQKKVLFAKVYIIGVVNKVRVPELTYRIGSNNKKVCISLVVNPPGASPETNFATFDDSICLNWPTAQNHTVVTYFWSPQNYIVETYFPNPQNHDVET